MVVVVGVVVEVVMVLAIMPAKLVLVVVRLTGNGECWLWLLW